MFCVCVCVYFYGFSRLYLLTAGTVKSDASGYMDKHQTPKWCNCKQIWRTEKETRCWFTRLFPAGNKILDQQEFSAMWVNQLKEQREHRICKSSFHISNGVIPFPQIWCRFRHFCLCYWALITMQTNFNCGLVPQLTVRENESRSINLELEDAAIWDIW